MHGNDYEKDLLLKRFKMMPEFKKKFILHKKDSSATWYDFAFELRNYFKEGWIKSLEYMVFKS